jgi:hypothetical protein
MARILLIISLAAVSLAAKDRDWQSGQLLDKDLNPYFRMVSGDGGGHAKSGADPAMFGVALAVNVSQGSGEVAYDDYVIEAQNTAYLVELARLKSYKPAHLSLSLPLSFAVEKNKLWIKDLDGKEYGAQILKQVEKDAFKKGDTVAAMKEKPAPAPAAAPVKAAPVKAEPAKPPAKPDPFAVAAVQQKPSPAAPQPVATPAPSSPPVAQPQSQPQPQAKPAAPAAARASSKDRSWQSGQLLSIVSNRYFFNVTFSSDTDGTVWPFVQGSDGRYTVNGQIGIPTRSLYTYDNYLIESQFCVYLVQRMRPKTSPPVRLPGTTALKFAVEKSKLWVLDEENIEYETRVVKLVQKDSIVDPLTRAAAR